MQISTKYQKRCMLSIQCREDKFCSITVKFLWRTRVSLEQKHFQNGANGNMDGEKNNRINTPDFNRIKKTSFMSYTHAATHTHTHTHIYACACVNRNTRIYRIGKSLEKWVNCPRFSAIQFLFGRSFRTEYSSWCVEKCWAVVIDSSNKFPKFERNKRIFQRLNKLQKSREIVRMEALI